MEFGYHNASFETHDEDEWLDATLTRASRLDEAGFSWFSCMDHLWQISVNGYHDDPFFDCYTVLPAVAAATDSMELSALVTSPHYRNPGYLGRILTTLDHLSGGRAVLGIGAGWFEDEYRAYGYDFPDISTRNRQMRETIELIRAMWTESSPVTYAGEHYAIDDLILEPKPVQEPHPPVLVGGGGEQLTLRAVAEYADRWNVPGVDPETYGDKLEVLADHCARVDRPFEEIEKTVLTTALTRETDDAAHAAYEEKMARTELGPASRDTFRGAIGSPDEVERIVGAFADRGVERVIIKAMENDPATIDRFVEEILPAF